MAISNTSREQLTLDDYLVARHLVVSPWNETQGVPDLEPERRGYSRQNAIKTPSMFSAPFIIEDSDILMAIPRSAAEKFAVTAQLKIFQLPFQVPPFEVKIYSHRRSGKRGATHWLKQELQKMAQG